MTVTPVGSNAELRWDLEWTVAEYWPTEELVRGKRRFRTETLQSAFGLSDTSPYHGRPLIERFGGEAASQGEFIRWRDFLNIPGPGTGHDGDANISIRLSPQTDKAICQLIAHAVAFQGLQVLLF